MVYKILKNVLSDGKIKSIYNALSQVFCEAREKLCETGKFLCERKNQLGWKAEWLKGENHYQLSILHYQLTILPLKKHTITQIIDYWYKIYDSRFMIYFDGHWKTDNWQLIKILNQQSSVDSKQSKFLNIKTDNCQIFSILHYQFSIINFCHRCPWPLKGKPRLLPASKVIINFTTSFLH